MFNVNKGNTRGTVRGKGKGKPNKIEKDLKIHKAPRPPTPSK